MRQHVNPLSKNFHEIETIPSFNQIFENPKLPLHLDIGSAAGDFLLNLSFENQKWNYLGIEIREKLVRNARLRVKDKQIKNLYFAFGNANNIFNHDDNKSLINSVNSISFNFPDPWFKKKHHKRRVIQPEFIDFLSNTMQKRSLIFIKTDVSELFDYMDFIMSKFAKFKKLAIENFRFKESFNPNKIPTNREKYVSMDQFEIFESIYMKI